MLAENISLSGSLATSFGYVTLDGGNQIENQKIKMEFGTMFLLIKMKFGTTFLLMNTLSKLGIQVGKTAKEVIGTLVTSVSLIFMVTDIVFLVKDWQSEHPTIEYLVSIVETLQKELEPIKELFMFFSTFDYDNDIEYRNQIQ